MNEYYRTKDGIIGKYIMHLKGDGITDYGWRVFDVDILWYDGEWTDRIPEDYWDDFCHNDVVAISPNLIDLIEEGDYVNGYLINYIADDEKAVYHDALDYIDVKKFENKNIKSIVTKEQFNNMSYKVVD